MRAQYFSFDAIIASVIFIMAVVALLSYWHSIKSYLDGQNDQMNKDIVRISDLLFSPPTPSSNCTDIAKNDSKIGFSLAQNDRRVDYMVLDCLDKTMKTEPDPNIWLSEKVGTPYKVAIEANPEVGGCFSAVTLGTLPDDKIKTNQISKIRRVATVLNNGKTCVGIFDITLYDLGR